MNWKNRLTNYNFWISIVSAALLILQAFKFEFDIAYINEIVTAVLGLLVVIGIISDPTRTSVKSQNSIKKEDAENSEEKTIPCSQKDETDSFYSKTDYEAIVKQISKDINEKLKEFQLASQTGSHTTNINLEDETNDLKNSANFDKNIENNQNDAIVLEKFPQNSCVIAKTDEENAMYNEIVCGETEFITNEQCQIVKQNIIDNTDTINDGATEEQLEVKISSCNESANNMLDLQFEKENTHDTASVVKDSECNTAEEQNVDNVQICHGDMEGTNKVLGIVN